MRRNDMQLLLHLFLFMSETIILVEQIESSVKASIPTKNTSNRKNIIKSSSETNDQSLHRKMADVK